jgi:hypothetical protein
MAQHKKLVLKTDVTKTLPVGLGDKQRLTQVLLNLVGNAIKFTDVGEVRATAKAVNGHFNVTVADAGPGIPQEHQARIFDEFHEVDGSLTKAKGRHRPRHRQADRGDARRPHLGRDDGRQGIDVPDGDSHARRHHLTKPYSRPALAR